MHQFGHDLDLISHRVGVDAGESCCLRFHQGERESLVVGREHEDIHGTGHERRHIGANAREDHPVCDTETARISLDVVKQRSIADEKHMQPEALFNAAACFEELGQAVYAEKMRKKLMAEYPQSTYTRRIQSES